MITDLNQTLENLLRTEGKIPKSDVDIEFEQPTGEWSATLSRPTINLWCFDVRENVKLRRRELDHRRKDGRTALTMMMPRRMDLSLLVTAWARKVEDEHQLLWRTLKVFRTNPRIERSKCEGGLRYQNYDIQLVTADMSDVTINMTDLWSVLDNRMKLGFISVATVELELDTAIEAPLVLQGEFRVRQIVDATVEEEEDIRGVITTREGDYIATTEEGERYTTPDVRIVHQAEDLEDE
ncbi:MAG: DUF4255 domain-containing protein [Chloroflexota bacterium]